MKKILAISLVVLLAMSFFACSNNKETETATVSKQSTQSNLDTKTVDGADGEKHTLTYDENGNIIKDEFIGFLPMELEEDEMEGPEPEETNITRTFSWNEDGSLQRIDVKANGYEDSMEYGISADEESTVAKKFGRQIEPGLALLKQSYKDIYDFEYFYTGKIDTEQVEKGILQGGSALDSAQNSIALFELKYVIRTEKEAGKTKLMQLATEKEYITLYFNTDAQDEQYYTVVEQIESHEGVLGSLAYKAGAVTVYDENNNEVKIGDSFTLPEEFGGNTII